ncbi:MAG: OmpH family outer membrane protein [Tistlia sp.]|uniref:OmpH family outer membrane protein n=1 Tax=Tistlia sp. TaxID=3057121 RepID=UPI0034A0E0F4
MGRCRRPAGAALAALLLAALVVPLAALTAAGPAAAQRDGPPAVAGIMIVDSQRILREANAVKGLQAGLEAERDAFRDELRQHEAELRDDDAALTRERSSLSNEQYLQRRRELEQRFAGFQSEIAERRRALEGRFTQGMRAIEAHLLEIVGALAKERGIDLVLPKSAVLLADPSYEVTDEVMQRLNLTLPRVVTPEE